MRARVRHWTETRWRTVAGGLIVVLGTTMSGLLFQAQVFAPTHRQGEFSQRATVGAMALQRSLQEHLEVLYGLSALFSMAAQPLQLKQATFRELTKGPLKRYPGIQALGWIPRVSAAERDAYLAAARKEGMGDFHLTEWTPQMQMGPAARREMYYPIFYLEPLERQKAAVGFNLGSVPSYMAAMQKALSTEEAVASAWRSLAQDTGEQVGFLLFVPIYKGGMAHGTFEERRGNLQGFMMAMFRLGTLVEQSLQGLALGNIGLELSDTTDAASKFLLAFQLDMSHIASWHFLLRPSAKAEAIRAGVHWEQTSHVAGRTWAMLFYPLPAGRPAYAWQDWGLLIGGLCCTLLCAGFFLVRGSS